MAEDGAVYTCGDGFFGQLGLGDGQPRRRLTRVPLVVKHLWPSRARRLLLVQHGAESKMAMLAVAPGKAARRPRSRRRSSRLPHAAIALALTPGMLAVRSEPLAQRLRKFRITELCWRARAVSVHLQLRGQPGVHRRLTDLAQTYIEALAQSSTAAGPACRPSPARSTTNSSSSRAQGARGE